MLGEDEEPRGEFSQDWFSLYKQLPQTLSPHTSLRRKEKAPKGTDSACSLQGTCRRFGRILKPEQDRTFVVLELWFPWLRSYHKIMWHRSCDTGSAHPETQMQHSDICFRALIGLSFPVSGAKLEILCLLHHHNSILDGFPSHLIIHWVSTCTVSLGSHHNPISLCSANAIIQKCIVLLRFQEFSPVCEPA